MPQRFKSYGQIQEWITQECLVVVSDKTVHKIVLYKLNANAKLKVSRPLSRINYANSRVSLTAD